MDLLRPVYRSPSLTRKNPGKAYEEVLSQFLPIPSAAISNHTQITAGHLEARLFLVDGLIRAQVHNPGKFAPSLQHSLVRYKLALNLAVTLQSASYSSLTRHNQSAAYKQWLYNCILDFYKCLVAPPIPTPTS